MDSSPSFGAWLRRRRKALDITQAELADSAGCVVGTIRSIEADARRPSRQLAARLADQLQLDADSRAAFINAARGLLSADQLPMSRRTATSVEPSTTSVEPSTPIGAPRHAFDHTRIQLPAQPTALIGRDRELVELGALLENPAHRLITVIGPGGIGKTRLALAAAAERADMFADGAVFVALQAIASAAFVAPAILSALDIPLQAQRDPREQLLEYLRAKKLLLLLDNFEQLLAPGQSATEEGAVLLAALLHVAPGVTLLTTSRERLALPGEWLFDLSGLSYPAGETNDGIEGYEAVQLFVQRARQVRRQFTLDGEARAVARICRLVEGLPLAIELAAAALRSRSCAEIAEAIDRDVAVLVTGLRMVPERHRSIIATFEHSWRLLSEEECSVFARLSVFHGGFVADAAAHVARATRAHLAALVDKSLLRWDGAARYDMHELLRQYAGEKLGQTGESDHTRRQHVRYFLQLAEQAEQQLIGPRQVAWYQRLGDELGNLRAALTWSLEQGIPVGSALAIPYGPESPMPIRESISWLSRLLGRPTALASTSARAKALLSLSKLKWWSRPEARALAEEALALYRQLGDRAGIAAALHGLGIAVLGDDKEAGRQHMLESLALYRSLGDSFETAHVLGWLGNMVEQQQDYARAHAYLQESLALYRELGHVGGVRDLLCNLGELELHHGNYAAARTWLTQSLELQCRLGLPNDGNVHRMLGEVAQRQGDYEQARAYLEESLALYREIQSYQDFVGPCWLLVSLGYVALRQGDAAHAFAQFGEGLECFTSVGSKGGVAWTLEGLASLAVAQGQLERAVRLFSWADSIRAAIGEARSPVEQADVERDFAAIRSQLDRATIEMARAKGQAMTLEQAIAEALAEAPSGDEMSA